MSKAQPPNKFSESASTQSPQGDGAKHATHASQGDERSDLSHFKRTVDSGIPLRGGIDFAAIIRKISGIFSRPTHEIGGIGSDTPVSGIQSLSNRLCTLLPRNPKKFGIRLGAVVAVIALIIVGINVPSQVLRSTAFGLYEKGSYAKSVEEFRNYLEKRPNDQEARMYAALAAVRSDDFITAGQWVQEISGSASLTDNPNYLFLRALFAVSPDQAIEILNQLLLIESENAEGRFLRAILLGSQREFRRARDDFLQVDSLIRGRRNFNPAGLQAVHARIIADDSFLSLFEAPVPEDSPDRRANLTALWEPLSRQINMPIMADLYANLYAPALPEDLLDAGAQDDSIIGIYYTIMLLQAGEINEADVEFSKLPEPLMNASKVGILSGVRDAVSENYESAEKTFRDLSTKFPDEPIVFFNLANAAFYANLSTAPQIIETLDQAIIGGLSLPAVYHNRACLRLITGDFDGALRDAHIAMDYGGLPQTPMVRALAALAANPQDDNIPAYLEAVTDKNSPAYFNAQVSYEFSNDHSKEAFAMLQSHLTENDDENIHAQIYADRLTGNGLLMRAWNVLKKTEKEQPNNPQIHYKIARNALALNDVPRALTQLNVLDKIGARALADAVRGGIALQQKRPALALLTQALESADATVRRQIAADFADVFFAEDVTALQAIFPDVGTLSPLEAAIVARLRALDGHNAAAISLAQSAENRDSTWPVLYHAGIALGQVGESSDAVLLLRAAVLQNPANTSILTRLYDIEVALGSPSADTTQQSINNINRMLADPYSERNSEPRYRLIYPTDEEIGRSIVSLVKEQLQQKHDTLGNSDVSSVPTQSMQEKIDAVTKGFDTLLLETKDNKAAVHLQRGTFWMTIRDYPSAIRDFQAAKLQAEDNSPLKKQINEYLAKTLIVEKQYALAAAVYQELNDNYSQFPLYRRLAGSALARANRLNEAENYLQETLHLFPTDEKTYLLLTKEVYKHPHDDDKIIAVLRQAARAIPHYAPIYQKLSRALATGSVQEAKENSAVLSILTPGA